MPHDNYCPTTTASGAGPERPLVEARERRAEGPEVLDGPRVDRPVHRCQGVRDAAPALVHERYIAFTGEAAESLAVVSDGTGIELLGNGSVKVTVVLADGSPPGENELSFSWEPDEVGRCHIGMGDIGIGIGRDGRFTDICKEGRYTLRINAKHRASGRYKPVGEERVRVVAGETIRVTVRLEPVSDAWSLR